MQIRKPESRANVKRRQKRFRDRKKLRDRSNIFYMLLVRAFQCRGLEPKTDWISADTLALYVEPFSLAEALKDLGKNRNVQVKVQRVDGTPVTFLRPKEATCSDLKYFKNLSPGKDEIFIYICQLIGSQAAIYDLMDVYQQGGISKSEFLWSLHMIEKWKHLDKPIS